MLYGGFVNLSFKLWQRQSRIVRLPLNKIGSINKIKMYALLEQSNERPPSAEEIAKESR
jgi:DNA-directed RNA polymerase sigma subunit (sigma70/sigma32)